MIWIRTPEAAVVLCASSLEPPQAVLAKVRTTAEATKSRPADSPGWRADRNMDISKLIASARPCPLFAALAVAVRIEAVFVRPDDRDIPRVQGTVSATTLAVVVVGSRIETSSLVRRMALRRG